MEKPIFSICIPTWNRCEILKKTLTHITSDPAFDKRTEIVISDNCSDDNTKEVCLEFCNKFSNIHYSRNSENIGFANFYKALSLASGEYIKLQNDYAFFYRDSLSFILKEIEKRLLTREQVLFYETTEFHNNEEIKCNDANDLLSTSSYWITWISNCGMWRETLKSLKNPTLFTPKFLDLVDWMLQISAKAPTTIIFRHLYECIPLEKKGGYNFYKVFVNYYDDVLSHHKSLGNLNQETIQKENKKIYSYLLYHSYVFLIKGQFSFDKKGGFAILWKKYHKHLYAYTIPIKMFWRFIKYKVFHIKIN